MKRYNQGFYTFNYSIVFLFILLSFFFSCSKEKEEPKTITQHERDSTTIVNAVWKEIIIKDGVKLKNTSLSILNSTQAFYIVEVDTSMANVVFAVAVPPGYVTTSEQAITHNAIVAINGTYFFGDYSSNDSRHFVKVDNVVNYYTQDAEFATRATGVISVTHNIVDISDWSREKEKNNAGEAEYAVVSGPLIIDNGIPVKTWDNNFVYDRNPRTFMAIKKGKVILGVVDGRDEPRAYGISLTELRFFAKVMGYSDLINLDGGGSSTLYVKGYDADGVVNVPSDGSERTIKSIFYIKNKK
jgi:exopolysaccharide biosynthesis protein